MISYFKNLKIINKKEKPVCRQAGMTYVELIVVLSIFATMTSIAIFNYGKFQGKVDIKNLASDIALKVVEAQRSALSGNLSLLGSFCLTCKPSYGVYFDIANKDQFVYFVDLNNVNGWESRETLETIRITKNNYISQINICSAGSCGPNIDSSFSITFKRPSSSAIFTDVSVTGSEYIQITIKSPKGTMALIKIYPSGRVQVN